MFSWLYLFWVLLPLTFLMLFLWAISKKKFGVAGKENAWTYLNQCMFTAVGLAIAIYLDIHTLPAIYEAVPLQDFLDVSIPRFLLYPAVLLLGAQLQKVLSKKEADMRHGRTKAYQR